MELEIGDAYPSAAAVAVVTARRPEDLLFGPYGAGPALPALADVHARLQAGEPVRIADFGCGEG